MTPRDRFLALPPDIQVQLESGTWKRGVVRWAREELTVNGCVSGHLHLRVVWSAQYPLREPWDVVDAWRGYSSEWLLILISSRVRVRQSLPAHADDISVMRACEKYAIEDDWIVMP